MSLAAVLAALPAAAQAPLDLRVALVIGNSAYARAPLLNPANDAQAMAKALKGLGFDVVELRDGSKEQMAEAIAEVRETLKGKQGVGMLYYAGHGLQLDWRNYMVPVDARLAKATDVPEQTVDVGSVIEAFKTAGNRMNILVLDACRNNPFSGTASGKGLAQLDAPPGTFLAYATAPGNVAEDGDASTGNGLYTQFLLAELGKPAARIEDVFKRVRFQVRQKSAGRQIPWESTSLEEDFYFNDALSVAAKAERDRQAASKDARDKAFALEKAEWDRIKDSKNADDLYVFLQRYPNGLISEQAQFRLEQLQKAGVVGAPGLDGIRPLPASQARFKIGDRFVYRESDAYGKEGKPRDLRVTRVDASSAVINDGAEVWDLMGNLVTDAGGTRSPAKAWFPAELAIGKKWRSAYGIRNQYGDFTLFWDFKVVAIETVTVPAGTFKAFRIEGSSESSANLYQTETYWIDPTTFLMVKDVFLRRKTGGAIDGGYQRELVSVTRS